MIRRPTFKSCYQVEIAEPEGVFLLSEREYFLLRGALYCRLVPLINGRLTSDNIADELAGEVEPSSVYYALNRLQHLGVIREEGDRSFSTGVSAFWELLDVEPRLATRLEKASVSVIRIGDFPLEPLESALDGLNISRGEQGDISVIATDDYLREEIRDVNITALASGRPWLMVKPVGAVLWIGPAFHPGTTACWECLAHRMRASRPVESYLGTRSTSGFCFPVSRAAVPATLQIAFNVAAIEIAKVLVGRVAPQEPTLMTFDCLNWEARSHTVVRRPQCTRCGHLPSYARMVVLRSERGGSTAAELSPTVSPEQTFERYKHHVSPITGVVSRLRSLRIDDSPYMKIYAATINWAATNERLSFLRKNPLAGSGGRGTTEAQARTSALCEALERYSGIFQGDEVREKASYLQLGDRGIHPNNCMLFSENQYRVRHTVNGNQVNAFYQVPEPLDQDDEIEWTAVWSLTERRFKYLPTSYCYYGYRPQQDVCYCWADSNGNAAGNTLEEAIIQGMLELVERDSVALWWYNRVQRPQVDLECLDDPYVRGLVKYFGTRERDVWVLDLTSDLGIPAFAAVSRRNNAPNEEIVLGFGAHLDPRVGVMRALTELNQRLVCASLHYASEDRSSNDAEVDDAYFHVWFKSATLAGQPHLVPDASLQAARYGSYGTSNESILEDVCRLQNIMEERGMEVLVLDQTRPDIGLPVVKVVVPGLRPFWARLAPGRLYDVPVMLGWQPRQLTESELNPISMFL